VTAVATIDWVGLAREREQGGRRGTRAGLGLGLEREEGGKGGERAWEGSWASRPIRREGRRIKIFLFSKSSFPNHFQTEF
jgi:hypothetical protein